MSLPAGMERIRGAQELYDWFGYWPQFHDAEIINVHLNRTGPSILNVYFWHTTAEVDEAGYFRQEKHVVVEFALELSGSDDCLELFGFNHQNVIFGLEITEVDSGYKLHLDPCFGLAGTIKVERMSIRLIPGKPEV